MIRVFKKVVNRVKNLFDRKYDFYYIKSCFNSKIDKREIIVAGSSYSVFGIIPDGDMVCLGLPSQDFYYSDKLIRKYIEKNKYINKVILVCGYYSAHHDLSLAKSMTERHRIDDVYFPLLCDRHNLKQPTVKKNIMSKEYILKIADNFVINVLNVIFKYVIKFSGGYFKMGDGNCSREKHKRVYWNDGKKHWGELDNTTRYDACKKRVEEHERLLKYSGSYKENCGIIESLYNYLTKKKIELYIVIAPFPKQYLDSMSCDYCKKAIETCELLKKNSSYFYDCNNMMIINGKREYHSEYDEEHYIDTDHLSDKGAIKFTEELRNIIYRNKNL